MAYEWEDGMREMSGMGGGHEKECQLMLKQGLEWLDTHNDAVLTIKEFDDMFGYLKFESGDAKAFHDAIVNGRDATGAMLHCVVRHIYFIRKNGWESYVVEMKSPIQTDEE